MATPINVCSLSTVRFRVIEKLLLTAPGEHIAQVLPAADDPLRPDDARLVDEERERRGIRLEALRHAEFLLRKDRKAGIRFRGPLARRFGIAVIDDEYVLLPFVVQAVQFRRDVLTRAAAGLSEDEEQLASGEV